MTQFIHRLRTPVGFTEQELLSVWWLFPVHSPRA
jgi:hypothetical protein